MSVQNHNVGKARVGQLSGSETVQKSGMSAAEQTQVGQKLAQAFLNDKGQLTGPLAGCGPEVLEMAYAMQTGQLRASTGPDKPIVKAGGNIALGHSQYLAGDGHAPDNVKLDMRIIDGKPTVTLLDSDISYGGGGHRDSPFELRINGKAVEPRHSSGSTIPYGDHEGAHQEFVTMRAPVDKNTRVEVHNKVTHETIGFKPMVEPSVKMDAGKVDKQRAETMGAFKAAGVTTSKRAPATSPRWPPTTPISPPTSS
nr:hypothetical protein [uncultured bacterium]